MSRGFGHFLVGYACVAVGTIAAVLLVWNVAEQRWLMALTDGVLILANGVCAYTNLILGLRK